MNSIFAKLEAKSHGYAEAVMLNEQGYVCEGTGENLFTWSGIRSDYIDPEMAATNGNLRLYPWQRTYMFGVDVTF